MKWWISSSIFVMTCDFGGRHVFPIDDIDRAARHFVEQLPQNVRALPHLFQAHQIAIVAVARGADRDLEIVFFVIEIRMLPAQIVIDAAAAQVRAGEAVGDGAIFRDHADVARAIDEDAIPREEVIDFVELRDEVVEKLAQLREERVRQIARFARRCGCRKW